MDLKFSPEILKIIQDVDGMTDDKLWELKEEREGGINRVSKNHATRPVESEFERGTFAPWLD